MSKKVYLIHGFNVKDEGATTTGTIADLLVNKGFNVTQIHYGYFFRLRVRLCNKGIAHTMAHLIEPGSTCIAHSNGASIAYLALQYGAQWKNLTLINPALDNTLEFPEQLENIQVWYSPHDKWTGLAKYIPNSIWGNMGRVGYKGSLDDRLVQYNQEKILGRFEDEHSGIFSSPVARTYFATEQANMIR